VSLYFEDFEVGARHTTYARTITDGDHSFFCAFVGYHVPLFIDEEYARSTRYGGRICPSALIMALSTAMTESLFRTTVIAQLSVNNGRFLAPVRPGDTIRTEIEVLSKRLTSKSGQGLVVFRDDVFNQRGELVFQIEKTAIIQCRAES
jgi:3-hydroxybutyryl-CoA dehydratase